MLQERYGLLLVSLVVLFLVQGIAPGGPWQEVVITALSASTLVLALRAGEVSLRIVHLAVVVRRDPRRRRRRARAHLHHEHWRRSARERPTRRRRADGDRPRRDPRPARARADDRPGGARGPVPLPDDRHDLRVRLRHDRQPRRRPGVRQRRNRTTAHCLYFSFTTLTTVGYGDVLTRSTSATRSRSPRRSWADLSRHGRGAARLRPRVAPHPLPVGRRRARRARRRRLRPSWPPRRCRCRPRASRPCPPWPSPSRPRRPSVRRTARRCRSCPAGGSRRPLP